jgi:hypothetical protein
MAFQIRFAAVWRLVNFRTGVTPGRLFQISIKREAGHFRATLSSSLALRKRSLSALLFAPAAEANAVMFVVFHHRDNCHFVGGSFSRDFRVHDIHHSGAGTIKQIPLHSSEAMEMRWKGPHPLFQRDDHARSASGPLRNGQVLGAVG